MIRSKSKYFGQVRLVLSLLTLLVGVACSGNQKNDLPQGYLATHIFDNGSKQFVYTVDLSDPVSRARGNGRPGNIAGNVQGSSNRGLSAGVSAGTGSRGGGKGRGRQQSRDGLLVASLEAELKRTGYCREGFMELDRMTEPSQTFIKGECMEPASKNDISGFPNGSEGPEA